MNNKCLLKYYLALCMVRFYLLPSPLVNPWDKSCPLGLGVGNSLKQSCPGGMGGGEVGSNKNNIFSLIL